MKTNAFKNISKGNTAPTAVSNIHAPTVQAKLEVGAPNDKYEQEADAMADTIMRMPEQNFVQRKCADCEKEDKEKLHRKPQSDSITPFIQTKSEATPSVNNSTAQSIESSKDSGAAMDSHTQSFMSNRFGKDFSNVKIHTGSDAAQMNRDLNAKAFTTGNDIYFNEGQYQPGSASGKHLLAHELTHVVQKENINHNNSKKVIHRSPVKSKVDSAMDMIDKAISITREVVSPGDLKVNADRVENIHYNETVAKLRKAMPIENHEHYFQFVEEGGFGSFNKVDLRVRMSYSTDGFGVGDLSFSIMSKRSSWDGSIDISVLPLQDSKVGWLNDEIGSKIRITVNYDVSGWVFGDAGSFIYEVDSLGDVYIIRGTHGDMLQYNNSTGDGFSSISGIPRLKEL